MKSSKLIYIIAATITIIIPSLLWCMTQDTPVALLSGASAVFLFFLIFVMDVWHQSYMDKLLIDLSNLVDSITNLRSVEIFSQVEDTLLSKLQSQVFKLSGILKAQNNAIQKEQDEIKSLISDISHQIKTPVASIKMFGDLLQDSDLEDFQRQEYLEILDESLNKLTFLTDSLIKMSRLESGVITLNPQPEDLNEIILQGVKQIYPKAKEKEIEIVFKDSPSIKMNVDKNWTAEALFNIFDNGVKYTPKGGCLTIVIYKYDFFARIDIIDTGIGIPEPEQAKIFQRFYRGKGTCDVEGVGIGLYLSRKIVTDQGGYIKVSSTETGTTFSVYLPMMKKEF